MGVAKVVSIILKYVANGKINNEVIKDIADDFIDNGTDVGVDKVKQYIDKKKSEIDNILSRNYMLSIGIPEDEIGYIVAEVKSLFSEIEITDDLLIQCNYNCDKLSNHLLKEYHKINDIHIEYEIPIRSALFNVVKELINISLEDKDFVKKFLIQINNTADDTNSALKSLQQQGQVYHQEVMKRFDQMEGEPQNKNLELNEVKKFKNNKKSEYIKTWNSNLFLHSEENPKTLAETFVVPDFDLKCKISSISRLITKNLVAIIGKYINYDKSSNMLITGVPGIGKTSLIAKIANEYRDDERVIILRFRDWERSELKEGLLNAIYNTLKCEKEDLENKILILDGYDEIKVLDDVQNIINKFLVRLKDFDNFKCIITSRPTYIKSEYFANVIQLNRFKIGKVEEFYKRITDKVLENRKKIGLNLEVLGIPVILYMAIMSKIDISNNSSKPELYNRIFAVKGGIFDKFYDGVTEYSKGSQILRDPENIKIYLKFLETTAFMMYEKDTLSLYKEQCNIPKLEFEGKNISILDFPIKHLFEGVKSNNIEFIHKSIYEYFVAEYIFNLINEHIDDSNEDLAGVLGRYLINNKLSKEILEFLEYKIKSIKKRNYLKSNFYTIKDTFGLMLQNGMTYYIDKHSKNVLEEEINIFINMLEILHLWKINILRLNPAIHHYIKCNRTECLNLENIYLYSANLTRVNLIRANLKGTNLVEAILTKADLTGADLTGANLANAKLKSVDLIGAVLNETRLIDANLIDANLTKAKLIRANLTRAKLTGADLTGANLAEVNLAGAELIDTIFDINQIRLLKKKYNLEKIKVYIEKGIIISYHEYKKSFMIK